MQSPSGWKIEYCAGFLVPPCSGLDEATAGEMIEGSTVTLNAAALAFFQPLFENSITSCNIDIVFSPCETETGEFEQQNPIRDMVRSIAFDSPDVKFNCSKQLALSLALASDRRSSPGLFVVIAGETAVETRVTLFKFAADESLQAIFADQGLSINVIEQAFSRKTEYFKAAVFQGSLADRSFWEGKVEDKQATKRIYEVSDLWAIRFLHAVPQLTSARGTRLLAKALRQVIDRTEDIDRKQALIAAAITIKSQDDRSISLEEFASQYLPNDSREPFLQASGPAVLANAVFRIDGSVLDEQLGVQTLVLDNQFSVTGPFDGYRNSNIIQIREVGDDNRAVITLHGRIVGQKIRGMKSLARG